MPESLSAVFVVRTLAQAMTSTSQAAAELELMFDATLDSGAVQIDSRRMVRLGRGWQGRQAEFGPHPLTRLFVERLIDANPTAVRVEGLHAASAELLRCAHALGLPVSCNAPAPRDLELQDDTARRWWSNLPLSPSTHAPQLGEQASSTIRWDYGLYSLGMRNHALLQQMNRPLIEQLRGCQQVLDLGCGTGVLLDQLLREGIDASGVERDAACVRYARSLGLRVEQADALDCIGNTSLRFDGIVCSHFVEHLPIETVKALLAHIARALRPGGIAVLVFPDPESIRSQLLGFWRDPEHVRFYHPDLIASLARVEGLVCEFNSTQHDGRRVGPFSFTPPPDAQPPVASRAREGWLRRLGRRLGLASASEVAHLRQQLDTQRRWIEQLWQVNQTWAWEDNAILRLRKQAPS